MSYFSGILLLSVPDFGTPNSLAMEIAIEKLAGGAVRLTTIVSLGEQEDTEGSFTEPDEHRRTRKSNPRMPAGNIV